MEEEEEVEGLGGYQYGYRVNSRELQDFGHQESRQGTLTQVRTSYSERTVEEVSRYVMFQ